MDMGFGLSESFVTKPSERLLVLLICEIDIIIPSVLFAKD